MIEAGQRCGIRPQSLSLIAGCHLGGRTAEIPRGTAWILFTTENAGIMVSFDLVIVDLEEWAREDGGRSGDSLVLF